VIFVDASAIVALITREPDADLLRSKLERSAVRSTSPIAVYEAALAITRKGSMTPIEANKLVTDFLTAANISSSSVNESMAATALLAFERFGKGRHPAKLNMGDCFAYASARSTGSKLLFKGEDLSQTDIEVA
jgi:ribonuclease VapC